MVLHCPLQVIWLALLVVIMTGATPASIEQSSLNQPALHSQIPEEKKSVVSKKNNEVQMSKCLCGGNKI